MGNMTLASIDNTQVFTIRYDAEVTNLKYNYAESVQATLGSPYPYVRRNGDQRYRTFNITGLLSAIAFDENNNIVYTNFNYKIYQFNEMYSYDEETFSPSAQWLQSRYTQEGTETFYGKFKVKDDDRIFTTLEFHHNGDEGNSVYAWVNGSTWLEYEDWETECLYLGQWTDGEITGLTIITIEEPQREFLEMLDNCCTQIQSYVYSIVSDADIAVIEKQYRDKVIAFLHDGATKKFYSDHTGTINVRLTNITLTPKRELGGTLYSFSAQATEVA